MIVLALDTAAAFGSIALLDGETVCEEVALHAPDGFGAVLYDEIGQLLKRNNASLADVDLFAGAAGPGSFTGIRVGLTAVKGLAVAMAKPACGVSNLQALAAMGSVAFRVPVLDARRGEVYGAVYDANLEPVLPETVTSFAAFLSSLGGHNVEFLSTDFSLFREELSASRLAHAPVLDQKRSLAAAIGRIAYSRAAAGVTLDPAAIDANYVRRSDAELFWKEA